MSRRSLVLIPGRAVGAVSTAMLLLSSPVLACSPLWVSIEGGEAKLAGAYKRYAPVAVSVPCREKTELDIIESGSKFMRRGGSVRVEFDGAVLMVQVGLMPNYIHIPPNGIPVQVSLDDGRAFRGGAVLTAIQNISGN